MKGTKKPTLKTKKAATMAKKKARADRAAVEAKRAEAYSEMENSVCDLSRAAELAMTVFNNDRLFLFAVEQLDCLVQRFKASYYAKEFPI